MKKILFLVLVFSCSLNGYAKKPNESKILAEGFQLYYLEKAAWNASDDAASNFKDLMINAKGYLSYENDEGKINTIFYDDDEDKSIIIRYTFDKNKLDTPISREINSASTKHEKELIEIRTDAFSRMAANEDEFFLFYKNAYPNLIPIITKNKREVYILTGPREAGVVLLGNDYLLHYNKRNKFKRKEKIHNSLISLSTENIDNNATTITMHSHILSDAISPTDICTLLLYRDYTEWKQHYVISKKYVSIFDMEKEALIIITRKAWDKINRPTAQ